MPWPKLRRFIRFVLRDANRTFSGVRVHQRRTGKTILIDADTPAFAGVWRVSLPSTGRAQIAPGTVNGRQPMIGGVFLDGLDENGDPEKGGVPTLDLNAGPGDRRRSYVCLAVAIDPATGAMDPASEDALRIVHRPTLHEGFAEGGAPDEFGNGFWPIAQLTWSEDGERVERVRQWAWFPYTHRYVPGENGDPGRHWFRPA